jgi:type VI secretion system protein ImpA
MSGEIQSLSDPIPGDAPCGVSLEDSQLLASFDAFRLFGQVTALDPVPDWAAIKARSAEALSQSKDLRVLAHLAAAVIRTDGAPEFFAALSVAALWLESFWDAVHPLIDEDALLRRNALNCFADRLAVIDALRRSPLVVHPQLGAVSVRDLDLASGQLTASESDPHQRDEKQINAVFSGSPIATVAAALRGVEEALAAVRRIEAAMVAHAGIEQAPSLELLTGYLTRAQKIVGERIKAHPEAAQAGVAVSSGNGADHGAVGRVAGPIGSVQSREDAIRALDAIAAFFRQTEPSSPIPLIVERAKRLVSKDFLEVLADVAPDAIAQAKAAGGIRE